MSSLYLATSESAIAAATALIPLELAPAATQDAQLVALDVTFDAVFPTTYPKVEWCTYGTVGVGGSVQTPLKYGENQNRAANTVVRVGDTTAPTTITPLWTWYWSAGYLWPLGREFEMLQSGKYCIRITSPVAGRVAVNAVFSE